MKSSVFIKVAFVLVMASFVLPPDAESQTVRETFLLKSKQEAVTRALEYTGFDELRNFELDKSLNEVQLITVHDSTTPFLSDSINGKTAWAVEFENIVLQANASPITFTVILDAETGRLFEIRSKYEGPPEKRPCEPSAKLAEQQLGMTIERYLGLPQTPPSVSFLQALDSAFTSPVHASLTIARYVIYSSQGRAEQPVWAISLHGLPPIPVKHGTIDFMRSVINAETGERIMEVNLPYRSCDPDWHWPQEGVEPLKREK